MNRLLWVVLGMGIAMSGQAAAQWFESQSDGNTISGYSDPLTGVTTWHDTQGHSGSTYMPPPAILPVLPRNPC